MVVDEVDVRAAALVCGVFMEDIVEVGVVEFDIRWYGLDSKIWLSRS